MAPRSSAQAKLIDFGPLHLRSSEATPTNIILGTPVYLSHEGAQGRNHDLHGRTDQFSLAVVLYEMLSRALPFQSDNTFMQLDKPFEIQDLLKTIAAHLPPEASG